MSFCILSYWVHTHVHVSCMSNTQSLWNCWISSLRKTLPRGGWSRPYSTHLKVMWFANQLPALKNTPETVSSWGTTSGKSSSLINSSLKWNGITSLLLFFRCGPLYPPPPSPKSVPFVFYNEWTLELQLRVSSLRQTTVLALLICGPKSKHIFYKPQIIRTRSVCSCCELWPIASCSCLKKLGMLPPLLVSSKVWVSMRKRYIHCITQNTANYGVQKYNFAN